MVLKQSHRLISKSRLYKLTKAEAALIAATLPNPRKFNSCKTFSLYAETADEDHVADGETA